MDIGGRDGTAGLEIAERFGCRVIVVDPVQLDIDDALSAVAGHESGDLVDVHSGTINQIPLEDDTVDVVFSRDMLGHVEDLDGALTECRRVLTPSGSMLVHEVFGMSLLESEEKARLCADLASVPDRLSVEIFEDSVRRSRFRDPGDRSSSDPSGWKRSSSERTARNDCCDAARMQRAKDEIVAQVGVIPFRVMQANNLWTIYRMIGKLEERVYTLTLEGT